MTNWLVTGGCGFLGKNLIKFLLVEHSDVSIRVVDNFSVGSPDDLSFATSELQVVKSIDGLNWSEKLQVFQADIMDKDLAIELTRHANVVVHLAANTGVGPSVEEPRMDCMTNVIGTFNYLDACRINKVKRFVFASSGAPIGECNPPIHEEMPCHPVSPYGASKLAGEAYCSAFYRSYGVETVALRFGNVYGPGSTHKSSVVAKFIRQALNGETLEIYGDGAQTRDFIYTEDLVDAVYKAASVGDIGGEIFQIATNKETTLSELTHLLVDVIEKHLSMDVKVVYVDKRVGDVMRNFSDTSKAKKRLEWEAVNALSKGITETLGWFLKSAN